VQDFSTLFHLLLNGFHLRFSGGYGLGLAIAQRAIRLHGGDIVAQNHISGGLEVVITLPR